MNITTDFKVSAAEKRLNKKINEFETSMDHLATHVNGTWAKVEHMKDLLHTPKRLFQRGVTKVKDEPALYFAIAYGTGLTIATILAARRQREVVVAVPVTRRRH